MRKFLKPRIEFNALLFPLNSCVQFWHCLCIRETKSDVSSPLYLTVSFRCLEVDLSSQTTRHKKLFKYLANQKDHARTKPSVCSCHQTPTLWMRRQYFDVCLYDNVHSSHNEGVCFENEIESTTDIRSQC